MGMYLSGRVCLGKYEALGSVVWVTQGIGKLRDPLKEFEWDGNVMRTS